MKREVVIVSAVRTAIGSFGGSLKDLAPTALAARVTREALLRARVSGDEVEREAQDQLALASHRRAAATAAGHFKSQILGITLKSRKGETVFDTDEHERADTTAEALARMRTAFKKGGTVTAGNASGINDGAAALVLMEHGVAERRGLVALGKLVSYAHAGVDPKYMGIGPVPATRKVLERAGLTIAEIDVIEANEAFAAQACAVASKLGLDPAKVNPNGSGIGLGHPIGAIIAVKALYELQRSGGQGIAAIFERA